MPTPSELYEARITERGVATFLAFAGAMLIFTVDQYNVASVRYVLGGLLIAIGIGLWLHWRWARWLALGACFLILAGACLFLVWMFIKFPVKGYEEIRLNALAAVFAFAFGAVGYKGLEYLRSMSARIAFADDDQEKEQRLLAEPSATVVYSAGVWIMLLGIAWFAGLDMPWLKDSWRPERVSTPSPPEGFKPIDVYRDPAGSSSAASLPEASHEFPDLVPVALCEAGDGMGHDYYKLVYANVGKGRSSMQFRMTYRDAPGDAPDWYGTELLSVPEPDGTMMPRYDLPVRGKGDEVYVDLDSTNLVQESDETNNSAHFVIHRRADGTTDLPTCNRSYLHVIAKKGPTRTASTIAPLPTLPDLVMLGLCNRGHAWVAIRYVNRGAATKSAGFAISQGADSSHLEIMNKAYFPVPPPNEVQAFNVGEVADVIGRRGQSADIVVKLDDGGGLLESDKTNNIASAHVTHLEDGRVDLPDCDALEARAADPRWQNDEVVLQPAIVSLPDLVPLGACSQPRGQMDREVDIVYGNVGNGNVRGEVATRFREDGREFTTTLGPSNIGSNGLGRFQFFGPAPGRTLTLDVTLDSGNQLTESNEKNNSAHFEISGTEDKRFNLPDCSTRQRLADWL